MATMGSQAKTPASEGIPLRINSIQVEGALRTRESVVRQVLAPALAAQTFESVTQAVHQACCRLEQLEIMQDFQVTMDLASGPLAADHSVDVIIKAKEKGRFWARTGTELGNSEGSAHTSATFRNLFGGGERLALSGSVGTRTRLSQQANLTIPLGANPYRMFDLALYQQNQNFQATGSHDQLLRGLTVALKSNLPRFTTELGYTAVWRQITQLGERASPSIRQDADQDLKSAIFGTIFADRRDNAALPTTGYMWKLHTELAGIGGNVEFLKGEAHGQVNERLGSGFSVSTTGRIGALKPVNGASSRIPDRFLLGGPTSLRGFRPFGVGPRDGCDALGGDVFWSTGVSLFTPLPVIDSDKLKGHLWANAGGLSALSKNESIREALVGSLARPTSSVGAGLLFHHGLFRLELNLCLPLTKSTWDQARQGWQFGLGIDFL
ncbi:hypothetical protein H4R33_000690 [Dimargaris cristalligena]|uniref:Surface antigen-domain-containing protein n=1 Tax=Dimargaris cristalligena TaxID=215637 RepID=A0A4Q0A2J3_9FUNG|nr:hypothetical protein H4R33_000690 [Dimargaris cristalligena]RKP40304.1 surface antigen-domain-containing protein [Dimargaris cristalligena]|eukprot:RKP40304.1 surface antigen-domain-containing protein [Dimargaris cristalligena]